jgi:hypothetical protein
VDAALASRFFIGMIWSAMLNRHIFADPVMTKASSETLARSIVRTFLDGAGA